MGRGFLGAGLSPSDLDPPRSPPFRPPRGSSFASIATTTQRDHRPIPRLPRFGSVPPNGGHAMLDRPPPAHPRSIRHGRRKTSMRVESVESPASRPVPPRRSPKPEPEASDALDRKQLLSVLTRLKKGDFSVRLAPGARGVEGRIADAFNDVVELNQRMSLELA